MEGLRHQRRSHVRRNIAATEANIAKLTQNAVAAGALAPHVTGEDIKP
jgi:hypothetical protein